MSLRVDRQTGDIIDAIDINDIAHIVNVLTNEKGVVEVENLLKESEFESFNASFWQWYGSNTPEVNAPVLRVRGTGFLGGVGIYSHNPNNIKGEAGRVYYMRGSLRTTDAGAANIQFYLAGGGINSGPGGTTVVATNPVAGRWYHASGNIVAPAAFQGAFLQTYARVNWSSEALASGKYSEFAGFLLLDLTAIFGPGKEPTGAEMDEAIQYIGAGWFDRTSIRNPRAKRDEDRAVVLSRVTTTGPRVIFRFDDGYYSVLENAAPVMQRHGYVGTLLTGTHPTDWLGTTQPGGRVMTAPELLSLAEMGWEIGSHTDRHIDAVGSAALFPASLDASIAQIQALGLPYPVSFAYPNGTRNEASDVHANKRFSKILLTGGPEHSPMYHSDPMRYSSWAVIDGLTDTAGGLQRMKNYVLSCMAQGRIAVLGFHGITSGTPSVNYNLSVSVFTQLVEWLAENNIPCGLFKDTPPFNLVSDPGFEQYDLGFPWTPLGAGGWARTGVDKDTGSYSVVLNSPLASTTNKQVSQRVGVSHNKHYGVEAWLNVNMTAGTLDCRVSFLDYRRVAIGSDVTIFKIETSTSGFQKFTGTFTVPQGARVANVIFEAPASGFRGVAYLDNVLVYDTAFS